MKIEKVVIPAQEKTYWVAEDGRSFSTEEECFAYEKRASIRDVMNERTFSVPNPYESETEYWFIMGEEATPTYLISYIEYFLRVYISYWQKKTLTQACLEQKKDQKYYLIGLKIDDSGDNSTFEVLTIDSAEEETKDAISNYNQILKEHAALREKLAVFPESI
jgi:hypothetical protein